jgi:hypothetical protein
LRIRVLQEIVERGALQAREECGVVGVGGWRHRHGAIMAGCRCHGAVAAHVGRLLQPGAGVAVYKVEPYVVAGGSAGWMYHLLVESLPGLQRCGNQLRVRSLLPRAWPGFEMSYRFADTTHDIARRAAPSADAARVTVDGRVAPDRCGPAEGGP